MNIKYSWNKTLLGTKFSIIISLVVAVLLLALGALVFQSLRNNHNEVISENMGDNLDELYAILETEKKIRNEIINYTINSLTSLQNQADVTLIQPMDQTQEIIVDMTMQPEVGLSVEPLINSLREKASDKNLEIRRFPYITEEDQIVEIIQEAKNQKSLIALTMVIPSLRNKIFEEAKKYNIMIVDIMTPVIESLSSILDRKSVV